MFKDISKFNNLNDYLPLLNAVLITDLLVIVLSNMRIIDSSFLRKWYQKFILSAVIADVLSILLGLIITRAIYYYVFDKFSLLQFILLAILIQVCHDILFYMVFSSIPRGTNSIIDIFQDFAKEASYKAILSNSAMMTSACLFASYLANFDANTNIVIMISAIYILQYVLYNN